MCEVKPAVLQTELHPYFQETELKAFLDKEGGVIQAWYPLGHGDNDFKAVLTEMLHREAPAEPLEYFLSGIWFANLL